MTVNCLAQEHNTLTRPGLIPGPLDPESSVLTTRPPCGLVVSELSRVCSLQVTVDLSVMTLLKAF